MTGSARWPRLRAWVVIFSTATACTGATSPPPRGEPTDLPTSSVAASIDIRPGADSVTVLALGDNAYDKGSAEEYADNYDPTWGRFRDITRPIPGNHEYGTDGAAGYFEYFRAQIHDQPYYAWDAGRWRMYALNCDIDCGRGSAQISWLAQDRAEHADQPALAYVHEPFFTCSTRHPPLQRLDDIWTVLSGTGGQLLLSGNNHAYERFAELDVEGGESSTGLRQFVVGTGGVALYPLVSPCANREAQSDDATGVLLLHLEPESYSWEFHSVLGDVLDSGEQSL